MGSLGPLELFIIFLVILLVFGAKRIPEIARGLGKGIREFKSATKEITDEFNTEDVNRIETPRRPQQATQPRKSQHEPEPQESRPSPDPDQPLRKAVKEEAKEERTGE